MEKILVCITPQSNSHRLIDRGAEASEGAGGQLHILNIQRGGNIFLNDESAGLLQELFSYGSKRGGSVHALAGDDVPEIIIEFVKKHKITKIVLGEPPKDTPKTEVISRLSEMLCKMKIEIIILERETK